MPDVERYRAELAEPPRVMLDGPGDAYPRVIAEAVTFEDAEKIARALNNRGAVEACELAREFAGNFIRYVDDDEHLLAEQAWDVVKKVNALLPIRGR